MSNIKAIETNYNGYRFRSRAEARWAIFLEKAGIKFMYEPEGFLFDDGTQYLPDFYLPEQDAFLECKGLMETKDEHKIEQLAKATRKEIIIGKPDMSFYARWWEDTPDGHGYLNIDEDTWFCKCDKCGKTYFLPSCGSWACKCCGYYDGNNGFEVLVNGDGQCAQYSNKYYPLEAAKSARFEHGESGDKKRRFYNSPKPKKPYQPQDDLSAFCNSFDIGSDEFRTVLTRIVDIQGGDHIWHLDKGIRLLDLYREYGFKPTGEYKHEKEIREAVATGNYYRSPF